MKQAIAYISKIILLPMGFFLFLLSCKKTEVDGPVDTDGGGGNTTAAKDTIPADPTTSTTVGFFMDLWQSKDFTIPSATTAMPVTNDAAPIIVTVNTGQVIAKMPPTYYGNNSNLWIGQLNQQPVLMNYLISYQPKIMRGPAGSVSDVFFFNAAKDTPPADIPAKLINADGSLPSDNTYYWCGKNTDSWTLSTDGYYDMLLKTNSIGMLTVNYGYARYGTSANPVAAAAHLAADWVRYDKGRTKYWEVGNENFGDWEAGYRINTALNKDGQPEIITGALYGKHFRVFYDSMQKAAAEVGVSIKVGAVLYDSPPASWNTNTVKTWNDGVFREAGDRPDFYSVHSYFTNYKENSNAATILATATAVPLGIKNYVTDGMRNNAVPQKPIAMTEWNLFSSGSKQNVSHVAGVHAVMAMSAFIRNGYGASLRWDLANGWENGDDHGFFSLGDEPDGIAKWNPRPAFYYMYYYKKMTGDRMIFSSVAGSNEVSAAATSFSSGQKGVVLVNTSNLEKTVEVKFQHFTAGKNFYYYLLTGGSDNGEFSRKVFVNNSGPPNGIAGGPYDSYTTLNMYESPTSSGIRVKLPSRAVLLMVVDKK